MMLKSRSEALGDLEYAGWYGLDITNEDIQAILKILYKKEFEVVDELDDEDDFLFVDSWDEKC